MHNLSSGIGEVLIPGFELHWPLSLKEIYYKSSQKNTDIGKILNWYTQAENSPEFIKDPTIFSNRFIRILALISFTYKNESFEEECEWRLICYLDGKNYKELEKTFNDVSSLNIFSSNEIYFRQSSKGIVHYLKMKVPENAIKQVVLGPKNLSDKDDIGLLLMKNGFIHAEVEITKIPYS